MKRLTILSLIMGGVFSSASYAQSIAQGFGNNIPLTYAVEQIVPDAYIVSYGKGVDVTIPVNWRGGEDWRVVLEKVASETGLDVQISHDTVLITGQPHMGNNKASRGLDLVPYGDDDYRAKVRSGSYADNIMGNNGALVFGGQSEDSNSHGVEVVESGFELVEDDGYKPVVPSSPSLPGAIHIGVDEEVVDSVLASDVWEIFAGTTLEDVLMEWADRAGWTVVWNSDYSYPISASAQFRGSFVEVTAKLIRSMARAEPPVRGRYFKGNNVLVIETILDGQS